MLRTMDRLSLAPLILAFFLAAATFVSPAPASDQAIDRVQAAFDAGDYMAAHKAAVRILRREPDNVRALYLAGASSLWIEDAHPWKGYSKALNYLEEVLDLAPDTPGANYLFGYATLRHAEALDARGKTDEERVRELYRAAALHFERELQLSPGELEVVENWARALSGAGETERAEEAHRAWIAASPGDPSPYVSLAKLYTDAGRTDGEERLAEMLGERPEKAWVLEAFRLLSFYPSSPQHPGIDVAFRFFESKAPDRAKREVFSAIAQRLREESMKPGPRARESADFAGQASSSIHVPPEKLKHVEPEYPTLARKAKIGSWVVLAVSIDAEGRPEVLHAFAQRSGMGFEKAAEEAVRRWRYRPATEDGEPVDVPALVVLDFTLE